MTRHELITKSHATYEDVLAAPPNMVAEIIGGRLSLHPRPASRHARAASVLGSKIGGPFDFDEAGPGGWWIVIEPELHLGSDIIVPDLAGWRREKMPVYPDAAYFDIAPNWVCEVLSPSTRGRDLFEKRPAYAAHGVGHLWLVDPVAMTLEIFELGPDGYVVAGGGEGDDVIDAVPFEAIPLDLARLWPPTPGT